MAAALAAALVPSLAPAQDELSSRVVLELQQLREEVRELRGLVESQQREIETLRRRQRDQFLDLDQRLSEAGAPARGSEADPAVATPRPPVPEQAADEPGPPLEPAPRPDAPEVRAPIEDTREITTLPAPREAGPRQLETPTDAEQQHYDRAFRALRETRYADAAEGFDSFLREYPQSALAPNAQYWLGEVYYVTRDFEVAVDQFNRLLRDYPDSTKQGDALLKIGFSHYELRNWADARAALEQVVSDHPGTTLSRLAENRLRTMRLEGHF